MVGSGRPRLTSDAQFVLLISLMLVPAVLQGQTSNSAFLQGDILARDGSSIPRANIELLHQPTGATYRTVSGDDGHYIIAGAQVGGPYILRVSHIGFGTEIRSGLILRSFDHAHLDVMLTQVELRGEEVVVTGERKDVLSKQVAGASLRVDREQMDLLPHASGTLEDAQRLSPYMAGQSALGFNPVYNDLALDGIAIGDQFGLQHVENAPGGMQSSPVSMESIQEVRVDMSPFDVQQSGFTGATLTALTRSGSNATSGSAFASGVGGWWMGRNPDDGRPDLRGYVDGRVGVRVGGPIVDSQAFFFGAAEVSGSRLPIERLFGAPTTGGTMYSFSPAAISGLLAVLDTSYGYAPGRMDAVSLQRTSANVFTRFDLSLDQGSRLSVRYNLFARESDRVPYGSPVFAEGTLSRNSTTVHSFLASLNSIIGVTTANELRVGYTRRQFTSTPKGTPFPFVDVIETDQLNWWNHLVVGNVMGSGGNYATEDHLEIHNSTSISLGSHLLTAGLQGDMHWFGSEFLEDQWGRYLFASRYDLLRGSPSEYEYRYVRNAGAYAGARWRALQFGVFLQDEWTLSPVVTLSAGVRVDVPWFPDRPGLNPAMREAYLPLGYDLSTTHVPRTRAMVSPRLGFTIDPKPDHSAQIRGGVGIFTGRIPYSWIGNLYDHTGLEYVHIKESANAPKFVADPRRQPVPGPDNALHEAMEIVAISPDFALPQEVRWTFAVDLTFRGNLVLSLESVISRTLNGVVFRNLNLKSCGILTPVGLDIVTAGSGDARDIYGNSLPNGRWVYSRQDDQFSDVILMSNTTGGTTSFHTIQIQRKPVGNDFFASLAYSMGNTRDINSGAWDNAYDQWRYNPSVQPNEPALGFSSFDRSHRITAALSYQHEWAPGYQSTIGLVYTGISGTPYSYVYDGDLNGDGESLNDLFFIPGQYTDIILCSGPERLLYDAAAYNQLFKFIAEDEYLSTHRRQIAERNGARTPWVHQLDMRISQGIPLNGKHQLEVSAELLNVLNLLNASWGLVQTVPYQIIPVLRFYSLDSWGRPWFQWAPRTSPLVPEPLLSRWRIRLGVRYSF